MLGRLKAKIRSIVLGNQADQPRQKSLRTWNKVLRNGKYPHLGFDCEDEARGALPVIDDHTMASYERMVTLWQQIRYVDKAGVSGSLVECGTWKGGASGMMALAHMASGTPSRPLHLFDSFEGLPEPDGVKDGDRAVGYSAGRASAQLESIGQCVGPLEDNQHLMRGLVRYPEELTHYHVGWFQDTLTLETAKNIGEIAVLRIDGDWYESTKICLDVLFPQVSDGGIVVFDDYGAWPGCKRAVDEFAEKMERPPLLNHVDPATRYWIVAR